MDLRRRVKLGEPERHWHCRDAAAAPRDASSPRPTVTWKEEDAGGPAAASSTPDPESSREGRDSSSILPPRPWRRRVSMAAGLALAVLLALAQAWRVNAIHENLLWFSQLMVRMCCALMHEHASPPRKSTGNAVQQMLLHSLQAVH